MITATRQRQRGITALGLLILAGLVGVLAAWFPARRAARLDVLQAIATE
mgnify:CR=1 FL=1